MENVHPYLRRRAVRVLDGTAPLPPHVSGCYDSNIDARAMHLARQILSGKLGGTWINGMSVTVWDNGIGGTKVDHLRENGLIAVIGEKGSRDFLRPSELFDQLLAAEQAATTPPGGAVVSPALMKPDFVGPDWWDSVLRVAAAAMTRDELDRKVRRLTHDVYQAYQTLEGNALSRQRKDQINTLKRRAREAWLEIHGGLPPKPTRMVFVGFVSPQGPDGWLHVAAFEAAGGRAKPAGAKFKLETEDPELAREWGCVHAEARA